MYRLILTFLMVCGMSLTMVGTGFAITGDWYHVGVLYNVDVVLLWVVVLMQHFRLIMLE